MWKMIVSAVAGLLNVLRRLRGAERTAPVKCSQHKNIFNTL